MFDVEDAIMEETADTTTENSLDNQVAGGSGNPVSRNKGTYYETYTSQLGLI